MLQNISVLNGRGQVNYLYSLITLVSFLSHCPLFKTGSDQSCHLSMLMIRHKIMQNIKELN
jgi:hypothetical protein